MLRSELQIRPPDLFQIVDCSRKCTISKGDRSSSFFFILKLRSNLKIWCCTCSWREMEEQIIFSQTAEKPQVLEHLMKGFCGGRKWRQRLRTQPSEEATMLQLQRVGAMAPVISCCFTLFQLSLKKICL